MEKSINLTNRTIYAIKTLLCISSLFLVVLTTSCSSTLHQTNAYHGKQYQGGGNKRYMKELQRYNKKTNKSFYKTYGKRTKN